MEEAADEELMQRVKEGDYCAFDLLYVRYGEAIRRFLFQMTWDREIAEDYLQETFLRLYRARNRYEPTGKFSTFLFQIAKNYFLTQRRDEHIHCASLSVTDPSDSGGKPFENIRANARTEPEVHLIEGYLQFRVRRAIESLSDGERMVFVLSHFEDKKYAEIAELLQIPVGTVKSRMHTAVNKLKNLLREDYP